MEDVKKLKRAVIKEEFVAITGNFVDAIILNQFIYWTERVKDFDEYIEQENKRAVREGLETHELTGGWIYKTSEELADETMLNLTTASMRKHITTLKSKGFIIERENPRYKWDRTKQYRVDLVKITEELGKAEYYLSDYKLNIESVKSKTPILENKNQSLETKVQTSKNSNAIPETTTETTAETHKKVSKKAQSYDEIINGYTQNEILKTSLVEFVKMRSLNKRQPLTSHGLDLLLKKLDKLGQTDAQKIEIVDQSVMRGWAGFFAVDERNKPKQDKPAEEPKVYAHPFDDGSDPEYTRRCLEAQKRRGW